MTTTEGLSVTVHYAPATGRCADRRAGRPSPPMTPPRCAGAATAWSSSRRTSRTPATMPAAAASTAGRRSPPPEAWSGGRWSGGPAHTAAGVAGKRRSARADAGDVGQFMLMLLGPEGELMVACWICKQSFQDRRALRRHEMEAHLSQCTRCGARHSGKCDSEPKSVQDHSKVRRTH